MLEITSVQDDSLLPDVRGLFREYANSLGFHLCFQDFEQELAELSVRYAPPQGAILIGRWNGDLASCVAMKPLGDGLCEMKRFFVRPEFRDKGIGRQMAEAIIAAGRKAGYRAMRLDTVPSMQSAIKIYEALGFSDTEPYVFNPVPGVRYLELVL